MKIKTRMFVFLLLLSVVIPTATFADDPCSELEKKEGEALLRKAEDSERAGKTREAYATAKKVYCLYGSEQRVWPLKQRLGKKIGDEEEKNGRLKEAFEIYEDSRNPSDADRVKLKQVNAKPDDRNTVADGISHFQHRKNDAQVKELRGLAQKNADQWLAREEKQFAALRDSLDELNQARSWLLLTVAGTKKAADLAEKRGDTLAAEDARRSLDLALSYYFLAEKQQKQKAVRDKARALADGHAGKGELRLAAEYYRIAGLSGKADEMEKRGEAQKHQTEEKRQKQFKKDQDKLEKELGL